MQSTSGVLPVAKMPMENEKAIQPMRGYVEISVSLALSMMRRIALRAHVDRREVRGPAEGRWEALPKWD